jgi:Holliday junction resolvasome RuvABC endonuclease subunit
MHTNKIIGIDPGLRALGAAVLGPRGRLADARVLTAPRNLTVPTRLKRLGEGLDELLGLHRPRLVVLEATWPNRHPSLALVHRVGRLVHREARARRIRVVAVPSATVRKALLGNGRAGKAEVSHVLAARYPELRLYLRQDERWKEQHFQNLFDAVALALYAQEARLI